MTTAPPEDAEIGPCRECRDGKCGNCDGSTWDEAADKAVPCPCEQAGHGTV